MKIFITGASGFVGRRLLDACFIHNYSVSVWVHQQKSLSLFQDKSFQLNYGDLGDSKNKKQLLQALTGQEIIVHLAGKTPQTATREEVSDSSNVQSMKQLIDCAKQTQIKKIIYVSTQSVKITNPSRYGASKKMAEEMLQSSGLDYVILRPAIIYGSGEAGIFKKFVNLIQKLPVLPIPSTSVLFQPVSVDDVVNAILKIAIKNIQTKIMDVAGPTSVTFAQFIQLTAQAQKLDRIVIPFPMPVAILGAKFLTLLTDHPPVTVENLIGLSESTSIDLNPLKNELNIEPTSLSEGLKKVFSHE